MSFETSLILFIGYLMIHTRISQFIFNLSSLFFILVILYFPAVFLSCTGIDIKKGSGNISFALIGNTNCQTPYREPGCKLDPTFTKINKENPLFVIHMGDMICGGTKWLGIKYKDIENQYIALYSLMSNFKPILYNVKGEMDLLGSSSEIYMKYTKRAGYYSFNYGNIHFIILDTNDLQAGKIGKKQIEWLEKDLQYNRDSEAVFIFTHHPLFVPREERDSVDIVRCDEYDRLHKIFVKYPVKAVFSGHLQSFYRTSMEGILYVIAGCGGYNSKYYEGCYQYYRIDYNAGNIRISPNIVSRADIP